MPEPTAHERLVVVRALAEARTRGELSEDDQLERTDMAVRVPTLDELAALVEDLADPPVLPAEDPVVGPARRRLLVGALGLLVAGSVGGMALLRRGDDPDADAAPRPTPAARPRPTPTPVPTPAPPTTAPPAPVPDLHTAAGLRLLLEEYRATTGTWRAYVVSVSEPHRASATAPHGPLRKRRERWWSWNPDERWNTIFDPHPVTGSDQQAVDLRRFDLAAVVANLPRARRSLRVEDPTDVYLALGHDPRHGAVVEIVVGNEYGEKGSLLTDAGGRVLERRPFARS